MDITSSRSDFTLQPGTALTLARAARGATLAVARGRVWLTDSETPGDHFIAAGEHYPLPRRGSVVIECDSAEAARVRLLPRGEAVAAAVPKPQRPPAVFLTRSPHSHP